MRDEPKTGSGVAGRGRNYNVWRGDGYQLPAFVGGEKEIMSTRQTKPTSKLSQAEQLVRGLGDHHQAHTLLQLTVGALREFEQRVAKLEKQAGASK